MGAFGEAIRAERENLGWSQQDLADAFNEKVVAGASTTTAAYIADVEKGVTTPPRTWALLVTQALDIKQKRVRDIFYELLEQEPKPPRASRHSRGI